MKQIVQSSGEILILEVPAPVVGAGMVLIEVRNSCISTGTEKKGLEAGSCSILQRVVEKPERLKKAVRMISDRGLQRTRDFVRYESNPQQKPLGYSAAGVVLDVGKGVQNLGRGDRVACGGNRYAHHAEIVCVPRNLVVPIPDEMSFADASMVSVGAVALQGVRRANATLGERFAVIGMGLIGQLTAQLLRANGCNAVGVDLDDGRLKLARELGADAVINPSKLDHIAYSQKHTAGVGFDGVIITAASPSHSVISQAFKICRKKGRVVLVGDVGLHLDRQDFYEKEIDFLVSCSYGPGRYDPEYEEFGIDYPLAYVRWTENRNMAAFLDQVERGSVQLAPLVAGVYEAEDAASAYRRLRDDAERPVAVLLSYQVDSSSDRKKASNICYRSPSSSSDRVRVAVVGGGSFARSMHLPLLKKRADVYDIGAIVSRSGYRAAELAKRFGAECGTTSYAEVLADPNIDAVFILTRHNVHASMVLEGLSAGKKVFVEKPLALLATELNEIESFFQARGSKADCPLLLTGFNRRFSPIAKRIKSVIGQRQNPMIINYRMNAGYMPGDHWVHGPEGGNRNLGEACHIYDLFSFFTDGVVETVNSAFARPQGGYYRVDDNFNSSITFDDGSVANLVYTAFGCTSYPKEQMEIFVDGLVVRMDDYRSVEFYGAKERGIKGRMVNKGHGEELDAFAEAILRGGDWPIPFWQQVQATRIALMVEDARVTMGSVD